MKQGSNAGTTVEQWTAPWGTVYPNAWVEIITIDIVPNISVNFNCSMYASEENWEQGKPLKESMPFICNQTDPKFSEYFSNGILYTDALIYLTSVIS